MPGLPPADPSQPTPRDRLDALRVRFGARAAGWWRVAGGRSRLEQVAFSAADDLPVGVAGGFAGVTLSVPMGETGLGIVRAASSGEPVVSLAVELPADSGSGLWLRAFGATRSVAVPVRDGSGRLVGVVSLALTAGSADDAEVAEAILLEAQGWPHG